MSDAYSVGFKDGAAAGYKLAIEDMKLDKKPQIMKKYEGDHASLLARYNALVEAVHKAMDRTVDCDKKQTDDQLIADVGYLKRLASDYFKTSVDCGNRALAAEQKYDALRESVAWERECEQLDFWGVAYALCRRYPGNYIDAVRADFYAIRDAARAEVDRLLENEP